MGNVALRIFEMVDMFLHGTFETSVRSQCNGTEAVFPVPFFRPGEYSHAQEEIHHVFGACAGGMALLWLGQIMNRIDKSFVLLWSGRCLMFMGYFLFLWLFFLMSPRNAGPQLVRYVFGDWQQLQHVVLAFIFVAAGTAETVSGHILVREKLFSTDMMRTRKITTPFLLALHALWTAHLFCAGVIFLFHPQIHPSHLAMHRVLGASVICGSLTMGLSKCVETLTTFEERLRHYPLMLLPQAFWIAVIQILLFFPHHSVEMHMGFRPRCQPKWLRTFVFVSLIIALTSISASAVVLRSLSTRILPPGPKSRVDARQRVQLIRKRDCGSSDSEDFLSSSSESDCEFGERTDEWK